MKTSSQFENVRNLMTGIREADRGLRNEYAALTGEQSQLQRALPQIEEIVSSLHEVVQRRSRAWVEDQAYTIVHAFSKYEKFGSTKMRTHRPELPKFHSDPGLTLDDLCGLVPELVIERFEKIIRAHAPEGLPASERAKRLDVIAKRLAAIETEHTAFVDEAAAFDPPIELQLLPVVRERRAAAAAQQTYVGDTRQRREALERDVNG